MLPDAYFLSSRCQSPSSRAQNRHFCALLGSGTLVFGLFEHKIEVFVRFWGLEPSFSGFSSTKSGFLCSRGGESGIGKRNRGDAYHFAAAPLQPHQRTDTSNGPQQWHQAPSSAVLAPCSAVHAPSSAVWCHVVLSRCRVMPVGCRNGAVMAPLWNGIRLAAGLSSRMVVGCPSV